MTQLFHRVLLPIRHSLSCLDFVSGLKFLQHPFEALKFSSCICSATATAFARSMGPETGMFLLLAIRNHSNIAESMFWNLHILALLLAAFPFVANLSSNFRLSRRVDWICVLPHWNFSAISRFRLLDFCLCRQLHLQSNHHVNVTHCPRSVRNKEVTFVWNCLLGSRLSVRCPY